MKNKILVSILLISTMLLSTTSIAQESHTDYAMVVLVHIDVKIGMEKAFEKAVIEHNSKYHNEAPNKGWLNQLMSGENAGTYAWVMGPCTFTDLSNMNPPEAHEKHWDEKVVPMIKKYGSQEYWRFNKELSYMSDLEAENGFSEIWFVDLERGDYYRFKSLMSMIVEAFEKQGDGSVRVYDNQFNSNNGRDVALVFDMKNLAQIDENNSIKGTYEEIHGDGSWDTMLDEWTEITLSIDSQLWRSVKE
ncbi:hypothetical protein KH5_16970 [Urechidicola sp. KH5]